MAAVTPAGGGFGQHNRAWRKFFDVYRGFHGHGFSGAIMPQNIVVGEDAAAVAAFVAEYSGREAEEE